MATIKELQRKIVIALETGKDPAPILKELAGVRAALAMEADQAEAQKIADERQALKKRAEGVIATVARQAAAVDEFLAYRDKILPQLQEFIEPMKELARMGRVSWERDASECYIYAGPGPFQGAIRGIPHELLPDDFNCPTLEMAMPGEHSIGKSDAALYYFSACIGVLANFRKGSMISFAASTDESLLLDDEPETETETETGNCIVCSHPEAGTINDLLRQGKALRDIEAAFSISRSTLSRHKNRCLNLGVIQVKRESSASSSNQTFFHK